MLCRRHPLQLCNHLMLVHAIGGCSTLSGNDKLHMPIFPSDLNPFNGLERKAALKMARSQNTIAKVFSFSMLHH